jgi:hypothetical protein
MESPTDSMGHMELVPWNKNRIIRCKANKYILRKGASHCGYMNLHETLP